MRLSAFSVARPITTMMAFLAIIVLGIVSYRRLPVQLIPDITFPTIGIFSASDRSTQENLDKITKQIESIAADLPRVKRIRSFTNPQQVWVRVDFEFGTDTRYALADLEERLVAFRQTLDDRRTTVNAFPFSTSDFTSAYMYMAVTGGENVDELFKTVSDKVVNQLKAISGVANVELRGTTSDSALVSISSDKLGSYGLNFGDVFRKLRTVSSEDTFLGRLRLPDNTYFVRLNDRIRTVEELGEITVDAKGVVKLTDVADIELGAAVDRWLFRSNGKPAIQVSVEREAGENMIELAQKTRARVAEINKSLPPGVELKIETDLASFVEEAVDKVKRLAFEGALLALLVPLLFFRSLRVSLIVFLSIPICLISVFNLFYAVGMSINIFSIVGLALGVGMLVDNAIVVVENTFRLREQGLSPADAAREGGIDVGRALFASTLTSVVVFFPLSFLEGEFKMIVKEPTLALVFPVFLSLIVALTIVPVLTRMVLETSSRKLELGESKTEVHDKWEVVRRGRGWARLRAGAWMASVGWFAFLEQWIRAAYAHTLKGAIRHRGRVLFLIVVAMFFTWKESMSKVKQGTTSEDSQDDYMEFYFEAQSRGATLSEMNRAAWAIEEKMATHPSVKSYGIWFNSDRGAVNIRLKEVAERPNRESWRQVHDTMLEHIGPVPGLRMSLYRLDQPMAEPRINLGNEQTLELKGLDIATIQPFADRLIESLRQHPDITDAKVKEERSDPLYLASIDREKSRLFNVNANTLGEYVGATRSSGQLPGPQLVDGDQRTDVVILMDLASDDTVSGVKGMPMYTTNGIVPMGEIVTMQNSKSQTRLRRVDRQSSMELAYYTVASADIMKVAEDVKQIAAKLPNPGGVILELGGSAERMDRRTQDFIFVLFAGALLVYVVMAAVFESFWVPFAILVCDPLMLIGIVWALDLTGLPMDDLAYFGVILLVGLAVNHGIVMMDRALALRRAGYSRVHAVFEASLTRLRPIMMTYLCTVLGLLPMAITGEEGSQWRPMAVVVLGGLTSATILKLFVLPCFYLIGDDFIEWAYPIFGRAAVRQFQMVENAMNALFGFRIRGAFSALRGAPGRLRSVGPALRTAWSAAKAAARLALAPVLDAIWLLRPKPAAPPYEPAEMPKAPAIVGNLSDAPPVSISNLQVIYPPTGWRYVKSRLPKRLRGGVGQAELGVHALAGIHLDIQNGMFGLLGPNGAGKTTMLRCIAGLLEPNRGTVRLFGTAHREAPGQLAPLLGYLPQNHGHYDWMPLYDYLDYFATMTARTLHQAKAMGAATPILEARLAGLAPLGTPASRHRAIMAAIEAVNLLDVARVPVGTFSGGMKQRAGIARILLQAPPILIVDEPTAGLDPIERVKVRLLLSQLAEDRLVIFSTHIVEDLEQSCRAIGILKSGRLVYHGAPAELQQRWHGQVWDVLPEARENPDAVRDGLVAAGARVLSQVVRDGREGFRVLAAAPPRPGSLEVPPSLEESLLAVLGERARS